MIPYDLGEANWTPFAQRLKDEKITALSFTGSPEDIVGLLKAMDDVGYRPELILQEANFYDQKMLRSAGASAEGMFVRTAYTPFEEPEQPAMKSYLDMMEHVQAGREDRWARPAGDERLLDVRHRRQRVPRLQRRRPRA